MILFYMNVYINVTVRLYQSQCAMFGKLLLYTHSEHQYYIEEPECIWQSYKSEVQRQGTECVK